MTLAQFLEAIGKSIEWYNSLSSEAEARVQALLASVASPNDITDELLEQIADIEEANAPFVEQQERAQQVAAQRGPTQVERDLEASQPNAEPSQVDTPEAPLQDLATSRQQVFLTESEVAQLMGATFEFDSPTEGTRIQTRQTGSGPIERPVPTVERDVRQVDAFIDQIWGADKQTIRDLQRRLISANLLDPERDEILDGLPSGDFQSALLLAIREASKGGRPLLPWLKQRAKAGGKAEEESAAATLAEQAEDKYRNELLATYMRLWGTPPPPGYVDRIASSNMNFYEFEQHERSKPSFSSSPRYQEERLSAEFELAQMFGAI